MKLLRECMENNLFFYGMIAAGLLGIWSLFWANRFYERAIKELRHLPQAKDKWAQGIIDDYNQRTARGQAVVNTEAFLRAKLPEGKTAGVALHRMKRATGYMAYLCVLLIGAAAYAGYTLSYPLERVYAHIFLGAGIIAALLLLKQSLGFGNKEDMVLDGWIDYLENRAAPPAAETAAPKEAAALKKAESNSEQNKKQEELITQVEAGIRQTAAADSRFSRMLSPEEENIMREVIREYMTSPGVS